jgi:hypothetical protein
MDTSIAKKKPQKILAIELFALNPNMTIREVAEKVGVAERCVSKWREDGNFIDKIYERYMTEFGSQLPAVINSMVREAKHGNVQAARLVLEHSGKLVKNVNITVDSPFEKFLKTDVEEADYTEVLDDVVIPEDLPPREKSMTEKEEKIVIKKVIDKELNKKNRNEKRKQWYAWKKRAEAVGIKPLSARRPTKGQRKEWELSIIAAEEST